MDDKWMRNDSVMGFSKWQSTLVTQTKQTFSFSMVSDHRYQFIQHSCLTRTLSLECWQWVMLNKQREKTPLHSWSFLCPYTGEWTAQRRQISWLWQQPSSQDSSALSPASLMSQSTPRNSEKTPLYERLHQQPQQFTSCWGTRAPRTCKTRDCVSQTGG